MKSISTNTTYVPSSVSCVAPYPPFQLAHILFRAGRALKKEFFTES